MAQFFSCYNKLFYNKLKVMKNIFFASLLFLSVTAYSQIDLGLYAGPNFANVNMKSPDLNSDSRTGFQAGTFIRFGKLLYGQVGMEYQMVKTNFSGLDATDIFQSDDVKFNYINVPLYAGFNLVPVIDRLVNVRVYGGPEIACLLDVPLNEFDFTRDDFSAVKVNGVVGAGVDVLFFSLDAGYSFNTVDLFKNDFDGKAHYAFINAGLKF